MFYELKRGRVGFITLQELQDDYVMYEFPQQTLDECNANLYHFRSNPYVMNGLIFAVIDLVRLFDVFGEKDRVAFFLREDLCLIVGVRDEHGILQRYFEETVERYQQDGLGLKQMVPERFLCYYLERLILEDNKFLENMEFQMSALEMQIMKEKVKFLLENQPEMM